MFNKILVANRGEIAVRIIRACREMGIKTVAVYSEADRESLHTLLADEAVCIGPESAEESYLDIERMISATAAMKADAVHPGSGFLTGNARFVELCEKCNFRFIGPSSAFITRMEEKEAVKKLVAGTGIPVLAGEKVPEDSAQGRILEFQVLADSYGNAVHLGERDCSVRCHGQKLIAEAPCSILSGELRKKMGEAAVKAAKAVALEGAATVEFFLTENKEFYFTELRSHIEESHPLTEAVTDLDLIKAQIAIAAGEKLDIKQQDVITRGYGIECFVHAEQPDKNAAPETPVIANVHVPGGKGVRVDAAVYNEYRIQPGYDTMLVKLTVHDKDRESAIAKMRCALGELVMEGVDTDQDFLYDILNHEAYHNGEAGTGFIRDNFPAYCK